LSLLFLVPSTVHAGTLTQTVNFRLASHGTTYNDYQQLPANLGPLNAVTFDLTATGSSGTYVLTNTTDHAISFNLTTIDLLRVESVQITTTNVTPFIIGASTTGFSIPLGTVHDTFTLTTNLDSYIGNSRIVPSFLYFESVQSDNLAVRVVRQRSK
jgi:hypothetical protein